MSSLFIPSCMKPDRHTFISPYSAKLNILNFHTPEVVSRYRDPQLQVGEKY